MEFEGKVALVTGAGSGIGKASALRLAAGGARIAVLSLTAAEANTTVKTITSSGGQAIAIAADVADEAAMRRAIDQAIAAYGQLDIVVANAGINGVWAPIDDITPAEWDRTIAINLRGTYLTLHLTVPHLKRGGGGSIIIVSSINGARTFSTAGATAYTATKAAQLAITQQLALELGKHRIRVNAVLPGSTETSIGLSTTKRNTDLANVPVIWPEGEIPLTGGKLGQVEDVADVVAFLSSDASRHVTGCPIYVD
ncbi:MAG TPA: SDR family NAD(P)-dependent oxidoreductase, partial [Devosia sp.]|nr:SDR family NAD(P)-dependent oxidoreductase [Devosia sp.]